MASAPTPSPADDRSREWAVSLTAWTSEGEPAEVAYIVVARSQMEAEIDARSRAARQTGIYAANIDVDYSEAV